MTPAVEQVEEGDGWAVANLSGLGEGPGFRKVRQELGVEAFGVNAIVMPPNYQSNVHHHEEQEEVYFVHSGEVVFVFGDGSEKTLGPGGVARVDAKTLRRLRNHGEHEAVYICFGGKDGYVGRDGVLPDDGERAGPIED